MRLALAAASRALRDSQEEVEGSGMGLAICRRIAERHGGTIWVEGKAGPESVFKVALTAA